MQIIRSLVRVGESNVQAAETLEVGEREHASLGLPGKERNSSGLHPLPEGPGGETNRGLVLPAVEGSSGSVEFTEKFGVVSTVEAPGVDIGQDRQAVDNKEVETTGTVGLDALREDFHVPEDCLGQGLASDRAAPAHVAGADHDLVHQALTNQGALHVVHGGRQHHAVGCLVKRQLLLQHDLPHGEVVHTELLLVLDKENAVALGAVYGLDHDVLDLEQAVGLDEVVDGVAGVALGDAHPGCNLLDKRRLPQRADVAVQNPFVPEVLHPLVGLTDHRDAEVLELCGPAGEAGSYRVRNKTEAVCRVGGHDTLEARDDFVVDAVVEDELVALGEEDLVVAEAQGLLAKLPEVTGVIVTAGQDNVVLVRAHESHAAKWQAVALGLTTVLGSRRPDPNPALGLVEGNNLELLLEHRLPQSLLGSGPDGRHLLAVCADGNECAADALEVGHGEDTR
mmetsp:Transcript_9744/g.22339  ORF Transcript_9744/g.22339 Transcript_9744/m.22339 type:complete len:452 (-) Transcript_9744:1657-3012(-)